MVYIFNNTGVSNPYRADLVCDLLPFEVEARARLPVSNPYRADLVCDALAAREGYAAKIIAFQTLTGLTWFATLPFGWAVVIV